MVCDGYTGVSCVNGYCPNAQANDYPEYGYEHISCEECPDYKGCEDCAWNGREECVRRRKE